MVQRVVRLNGLNIGDCKLFGQRDPFEPDKLVVQPVSQVLVGNLARDTKENHRVVMTGFDCELIRSGGTAGSDGFRG